MSFLRAIAIPCCSLVLLAACTVGPDYLQPEVATPPAFKEARKGWKTAHPANGIDRGAWWRIYKDPTLDALEAQVAVNNQNLKAYEAAFRQAQALVREARASLFPTLTGSPSITRSRSGGVITTTQSVELTGSWDLDLWGKVRRQIESDQASAQSSAAQLADLTLSVQAELATDYFALRYQDSLTKLLNDTVKAYEHTQEITQNQYTAGTAARSDVITAQTQVETIRASAIAAGQLRAQYEHAIALLVGKPPSELNLHPGELAKAVPQTPNMVPSELLERRPDIAEAERAVEQQSALIGVAVAAFYPTISLSGVAGWAGAAPLISATNAVWSLAASGSQTLFDGGLRSATVDAAKAGYDQSVANYRNVVLTAFQDVENALSNLRIYGQQAAAQDKAVKLARQAVEIAINEYRAGTTNYTTVVTAQATALSNEEAALQIRQNRLAASAALIKALGGGWDVSQLPRADSL